MKIQWLDPSLLRGPKFTLCTTEEELTAVLKALDCDMTPTLPSPAWATMYPIRDPHKDLVGCVVYYAGPRDSTEAMCGIMAHEAVHIWWEFCKNIGEEHPGEEVKAYAIQHLTQELVTEVLSRP